TLARPGPRPGVADRWAGRPRRRRAGTRRRVLVAGAADAAAHAGPAGGRGAAVSRRRTAGEPPVPPGLTCRPMLRRGDCRGEASGQRRSAKLIGTRPIARTAWPSRIAGWN